MVRCVSSCRGGVLLWVIVLCFGGSASYHVCLLGFHWSSLAVVEGLFVLLVWQGFLLGLSRCFCWLTAVLPGGDFFFFFLFFISICMLCCCTVMAFCYVLLFVLLFWVFLMLFCFVVFSSSFPCLQVWFLFCWSDFGV
ncbi:uncharacterized protein LOC120000240 isoform X1 [Tripterygium wilfordii]|uniref:uncharacterized protein LOC120000240 isoform X1 n=1 Tax=Tripterygium wilfordii TaxID=458696 RepID=UPI0018F80AA2|nr:uncharacterized protein LOC120000240 isoform X1 [Tripterygium wilfordii]